jgi:hypothetical protein
MKDHSAECIELRQNLISIEIQDLRAHMFSDRMSPENILGREFLVQGYAL